jgi:hypothetical protein
MTDQPDFMSMRIAAGGTVHAALTDPQRRILTAVQDKLTFVIAHRADRQVAEAVVDQHDPATTYLVLLSSHHLDFIALNEREKLLVRVLDSTGRPVGRIKVGSDIGAVLPTEHGPAHVWVTTTLKLHRGDLFTCGDFVVDGAGGVHGLVLYRALSDFDPATGSVERHIVTRHWDDASDEVKADLTSHFTVGPDRMVHRVHNPHVLRTRLSLAQLPDCVSV